MIELMNVTHKYSIGKVDVTALNGVSFKISEGEIVALVGPSGSGKTSVINLVGGLDTPTDGEIVVDKDNINQYTIKEKNLFRKNKVSFIFQSYNLLPTLTVLENVEFPLIFKSDRDGQSSYSPQEALDFVGLGGLESRMINELSGGQRQRVAVARAIVSSSKVLLADELTANLDGESAHNVMQMVKEVNKTTGTTVIYSTHDARILSYADRVISMADGKIEDIKENKN